MRTTFLLYCFVYCVIITIIGIARALYASSHPSSSSSMGVAAGVSSKRVALLLDDPLSALDRVTGTALAEYLVVSWYCILSLFITASAFLYMLLLVYRVYVSTTVRS